MCLLKQIATASLLTAALQWRSRIDAWLSVLLALLASLLPDYDILDSLIYVLLLDTVLGAATPAQDMTKQHYVDQAVFSTWHIPDSSGWGIFAHGSSLNS